MGVEHRRSPSLVGESPIIVTNSSLLVVNMSRLSFAFFALSSSILLVNGQLELRNFLGNCVNSGTNLDSCLLQLADKLKPYMKTGIPSLNIPKTDPMDIDKIAFQLKNPLGRGQRQAADCAGPRRYDQRGGAQRPDGEPLRRGSRRLGQGGAQVCEQRERQVHQGLPA